MGDSLTVVVAKALRTIERKPQDEAAAELANVYAQRIDNGEPIEKLGPALLATLEALGMTPRSRAAIMRKGADDDGKRADPLDELEQRRRERGA